MLEYRRRHSTCQNSYASNRRANHPILTYCNWSYSPENHLTVEQLSASLKFFDKSKIPFYLRLLNETPRDVVTTFMEEYNIPSTSILNIQNELSRRNLRAKSFVL